jgi:hypothetical protein
MRTEEDLVGLPTHPVSESQSMPMGVMTIPPCRVTMTLEAVLFYGAIWPQTTAPEAAISALWASALNPTSAGC